MIIMYTPMNKVIIICEGCHSIDRSEINSEMTLHAFWVFLVSFSLGVPKFNRSYLILGLALLLFLDIEEVLNSVVGGVMGGKRKRMEPLSYDEWNQKPKVWEILDAGNMTHFTECLQGQTPPLPKYLKNFGRTTGLLFAEGR